MGSGLAIPWRGNVLREAASHAAYLVENLAGRGQPDALVVPNGMYVVLPVVPTTAFIQEPEIAAVGFTEKMTPAPII